MADLKSLTDGRESFIHEFQQFRVANEGKSASDFLKEVYGGTVPDPICLLSREAWTVSRIADLYRIALMQRLRVVHSTQTFELLLNLVLTPQIGGAMNFLLEVGFKVEHVKRILGSMNKETNQKARQDARRATAANYCAAITSAGLWAHLGETFEMRA